MLLSKILRTFSESPSSEEELLPSLMEVLIPTSSRTPDQEIGISFPSFLTDEDNEMPTSSSPSSTVLMTESSEPRTTERTEPALTNLIKDIWSEILSIPSSSTLRSTTTTTTSTTSTTIIITSTTITSTISTTTAKSINN